MFQTYTVAQESKCILVVGLPAIVIQDKLERLMGKFGKIVEWRQLRDYPSEEFTETVLFKYHTIQSARYVTDTFFHPQKLHYRFLS